MAVTPKDEDDLIKSQKASAKQFSEAAKELRNAAKGVQKNSLRQELGLTKAGIRESLEDKLLGTGFKRVIYNFILDKKRERQLRKSTKLTQSEFKAFSKKTKQDKTDVNVANAQKKAQDARNQALKDQLGEEEANKIIESENAENHAEIIERDQILAESEKEQQDLEAAQRAEQSAADDEESKSKGEGSLDTMFGDVVSGLELVAGELEKLSGLGGGGGGGGKTGAEADKAAAEASAQSQRQTNALEKIAENLTGGGMGGKGADGGESSGDGGGGMLGKLGAGLGALGKGIGVLLKFAGKGLMIFLKMFAKGIMSFANPLVIGGLAVFTLGMIGLGAALRLAAPAFEAIAPVLIKVADVIGNVFMTAIKEIPAILNEIGGIIKIIGAVVIGIIDSIAGGIEKIGQGVGFILDKVAKVIDTIGNKIIGIINSIGASIQGIITSVAEGIATVVESFKGPSLEEKTASIERLSKIDPALMMATAGGIEAIGEALDSIGGGVKIPFLSAESPIAGLIELAKNSKGITDASNAVNAFVENAGLFKDGFEMDDSIISNIEKIVKTLSTGNPQALGALSDVIKSINTIDATKVGLLSQITLPQITPPTADEYERIFKTMQETQPNLIQSISSMFSNAFKRGKVGAAESKLDAISGAADDVTGGKDAVTAAAPSSKSSGKRSLASSERRSLLFKAKRAARDKYGPGSFVSKGTGSNLVFIPASSHPYVLEGKGDPANDSIRASRDSARQSMRASNIAASGGNQSSGQTNVNAPMTNNSRTITTTTNNHSTPHSPSVQSRTAQEFVGFSRGGGNPADF